MLIVDPVPYRGHLLDAKMRATSAYFRMTWIPRIVGRHEDPEFPLFRHYLDSRLRRDAGDKNKSLQMQGS